MIQDKQLKDGLSLDQLDQRELERHEKPTEKTISISLIEEDSTKTIQIKSLLDKETSAHIVDFL